MVETGARKKDDIVMTPIVYKQSILSAAEECRKYANMLKVQLGAGNNAIDGWLNTDIDPRTVDVYILDATKKLPFSDCYVDAYFCEHLIEHLDYCQQKSMLNECFRTLKHGGLIRLAFPSLRNLINAYLNGGETQKKWANWHFSKFRKTKYSVTERCPSMLRIESIYQMICFFFDRPAAD